MYRISFPTMRSLIFVICGLVIGTFSQPIDDEVSFTLNSGYEILTNRTYIAKPADVDPSSTIVSPFPTANTYM